MPLKAGRRVGHSPRSSQGAAHGENHERWLITYADMITLLMAFFIMMYAMSIVNLGKFSELATSVRSGFGGDSKTVTPPTEGGGEQVLPGVLPANAFELMTHIAGIVRRTLDSRDRQDVEFLSEEGMVTVRVKADDVLFARGSAELTPHAVRILRAVARGLRGIPYPLRIEGHTCNLPIHTSRYPTNWELSAQRAINVALYFIRSEGFSPRGLSATGFADTMPVAPNDTEANRARNRRIDILVQRSSTDQPAAASWSVAGRAPDCSPVTQARPAPVNLVPPITAALTEENDSASAASSP